MLLVEVVQQHQQAVPNEGKLSQGQTGMGVGTTRMLPLGLLPLRRRQQRLLSQGTGEILEESLRQQSLLQVSLAVMGVSCLSFEVFKMYADCGSAREYAPRHGAGRYTLQGITVRLTLQFCEELFVPGQQSGGNLATAVVSVTDFVNS